MAADIVRADSSWILIGCPVRGDRMQIGAVSPTFDSIDPRCHLGSSWWSEYWNCVCLSVSAAAAAAAVQLIARLRNLCTELLSNNELALGVIHHPPHWSSDCDAFDNVNGVAGDGRSFRRRRAPYICIYTYIYIFIFLYLHVFIFVCIHM